MKIHVPLNPPLTELNLSDEESRCRQLMQSFVSERYTEALMETPEVQKAFVSWLEDRSREASKKTRRWEFRRLKAMAAQHPVLSTLEREAERFLLETRNTVVNKAEKAAVSRLVTEDFLKRMQSALSRENGITPTMRNALVLFSATLMTGLRPTEWRTAKLYRSGDPLAVSGIPRLIVQTAKGKDGEARERVLVLEGFSTPQLDMLESAIGISGDLTNAQLGHLSTGLRRLGRFAVETAESEAVLSSLELSSARKMFAVECLREGRSEKEVAAAMGHTTTVNLRWYAQGDIYRDRAMRYPLARVTEEAAMAVRDTLQEFKDGGRNLEQALDAVEATHDTR
jgi:hypothetical protein